MYKLIVNNVEYRQSDNLAVLEALIDQIPHLLIVIQEFIPGFGWRSL